VPGSASGGPRPRVKDADRERLIALLREHYAHGQLDHDELDRRLGVVLTAQYMDELAPAVADLPGLGELGAAGSQPARQRRGHAQASTPAAGWIPTDERFRDPATRVVIRVWIDPADHSRHYVPEPDT
jgi:Domain of unknown function (DUF1707)